MPKLPKLTPQQLLARAPSEAELQHFIMGTSKEPGLAIVLGWTVFHVRDSRGQRVVGLPDLILVRPPKRFPGVWSETYGMPSLPDLGRLEWWELKTERGKVTPVQTAVHELLRACGQTVRVVRPRDWLDGAVEKALR